MSNRIVDDGSHILEYLVLILPCGNPVWRIEKIVAKREPKRLVGLDVFCTENIELLGKERGLVLFLDFPWKRLGGAALEHVPAYLLDLLDNHV